MVPERGDTDIRGQTDEVLTQVQHWLQAAGSDKSRILRAQIYLANMADIAEMNAVWDAWVPAGDAPPRATVQAALADPVWRIEVVATAAQV
jgi:enamine deaminase RidA (YjgF/YER057c/UK114 family)